MDRDVPLSLAGKTFRAIDGSSLVAPLAHLLSKAAFDLVHYKLDVLDMLFRGGGLA